MKLFDRLDAIPPLSAEERQIVDSVESLARDRIAPRAEHYDRSAEFPLGQYPRDQRGLGLKRDLCARGLWRRRAQLCPLILPVVREISKGVRFDRHHLGDEFSMRTKPLIDFRYGGAKAAPVCRVSPRGALAALPRSPSRMPGRTRPTWRRASRPPATTVVVSGTKTFITNGDVADLILVFWQMGRDHRRQEGPSRRFILERGTPGFAVLRTEDKMGAPRLVHPPALAFEDCVVPRANFDLWTPGPGCPCCSPRSNKSRAERCRSCSRHRPRRLRGRCRLYQRASANRAAASSSSRASSSCSPISRPISQCARRGCGTSRISSTAASAIFGPEASMLKMAGVGPGHAGRHRGPCSCTAATAIARTTGSSG